jgi:hypothetical protein
VWHCAQAPAFQNELVDVLLTMADSALGGLEDDEAPVDCCIGADTLEYTCRNNCWALLASQAGVVAAVEPNDDCGAKPNEESSNAAALVVVVVDDVKEDPAANVLASENALAKSPNPPDPEPQSAAAAVAVADALLLSASPKAPKAPNEVETATSVLVVVVVLENPPKSNDPKSAVAAVLVPLFAAVGFVVLEDRAWNGSSASNAASLEAAGANALPIESNPLASSALLLLLLLSSSSNAKS